MKQTVPNRSYEDEKRLVRLFGCIPLPFSGSRGKKEDGECKHFKVQTKHMRKEFSLAVSELLALRKHARFVHKLPVLLTEVQTEEQKMVGMSDVYVTIPLENLDAFLVTYSEHREICMQERGDEP